MAEDDLIIERAGPLAKLTLNRPKALNALTHDQTKRMRDLLADWAEDDGVRCLLLAGAGGRAFCSGGDVRAVRAAVVEIAARTGGYDPRSVDRGETPFAFFVDEYSLNAELGAFPKPIVSLLDGVAMGGGLGLALHGSHRVATERILMAMPEQAIGLFPDVGSALLLYAAPGGLGLYLAATGARIKGAADALYSGFATHAVASEQLDAVAPALATANWDSEDAEAVVDGALAPLALDAGAASFAAMRPGLDRCFANDATPETSIAALGAEDGDWAVGAAEALRKGSPTSIRLAYAQRDRAVGLTLPETLQVDFRLAQFCMSRPDFAEGVRAVLIDKDGAASWSPAALDAVADDEIDAAFAPLDGRDLFAA
ncbi:MAG: enoyl-CoA hydratase/isomerase family protein [Pseudomonadota bacterium]